ncbi:glycosyltransferase [Paracrocinitomix mangrovi]|uniref:glycosyltransferase family 2 protein n=1 Tax=Paracrocinitomix mangrovi TaxID=2862509 RepID=UPI001C8D2651|nr:glycosyltransferase family 2 protein [Paracrocinitomix mangrovi]UKN02081.1 glycosyltransferase [Paracrocinitomix mangrovi]
MKISIVTVSYNSADTIKDTIESVVHQKDVELEYIIVDGGSTDGTVEIVESYGDKIHQFVSEADKGIYDGMNKGVAMATGDVIGILNSDDLYTNNEVLKNVLAKFEDAIDGVYANLVYVDQNDLNKVRRTWISGNYIEGSFKKGWMPPHPTFFVRKKYYEKYGSYSLNLRSAADYELMLRFIHKNKINLAYLNEVIVKMRIGGQSNASLKNRLKANKEDRMAWKMNGLKPSPLTFIRKPISKIGQFFKR